MASVDQKPGFLLVCKLKKCFKEEHCSRKAVTALAFGPPEAAGSLILSVPSSS
jgi:hypothetical protein